MIVVSDTSTITNLAQIGLLKLLEKLYGQVLIPERVFLELSEYEDQKEVVEGNSWIKVERVQDIEMVVSLSKFLDLGEAEAIALSKELKSDLLLIDERKGRKIAKENGLKIIGLLGVLVAGKRKGYIDSVATNLEILMKEVGFRVSKSLVDKVLETVGE